MNKMGHKIIIFFLSKKQQWHVINKAHEDMVNPVFPSWKETQVKREVEIDLQHLFAPTQVAITPRTHHSEPQVICQMGYPVLQRAAVRTVWISAVHAACVTCSIKGLCCWNLGHGKRWMLTEMKNVFNSPLFFLWSPVLSLTWWLWEKKSQGTKNRN